MATPLSAQFTTGHVGLNVSNLARSTQFYQRVFGFDVAGESTDKQRPYAFLSKNRDIVLTLWQQSDGTFLKDRPGLHHLSFRVDSITQVREAEQRLRELGAVIHHGGIVPHAEGADSGGVYFEDPDGIRLEIFTASGAGGTAAPHQGAPTCGFF